MRGTRDLESRWLAEPGTVSPPGIASGLRLSISPPTGGTVVASLVGCLAYSSAKGNITLSFILTSDRTREVPLLVLLQRAGIKGKAFFKGLEPLGLTQGNNLLITLAGLDRTRGIGGIDPVRARAGTAYQSGDRECS